MSQPWALAAPTTAALEVARLPRRRGLAICCVHDELWVRGQSLDDELDDKLRLVPGGRRYALLADNQLIPVGKLVPRGRLPERPWQLFEDWLDAVLAAPPVAGYRQPQGILATVPLEMVRTASVRESSLLETSLAVFCDYVAPSPQWRVARWSFVATSDGRALVRGTPLPPLPGEQWTEDHGVCVPAGFGWQPAVEAAIVRQVIGLLPEELALLRPDGTWERIAADQWVRCTRAAARLTKEACQS